MQTSHQHLPFNSKSIQTHLFEQISANHKITISEQIELQSEPFFLSIEQCFARRKNSPFEDIPSLKASIQQT